MQAKNISLTQPISQALERARVILFQPFDVGRWFVIGFCAWLAYLGENGFGGGGHFNFGDGRGGSSLRDAFEQTRSFVVQNLAWLLPVAAAVLMLALILGLALAWVRSRGQFMFLHCVAFNRAEVNLPWH